ncbi:MAG: hypothetical protein A3B08_02950 [Candidatus Taylorbacteria bacterium RIFCSPLOWO2_01_FULL_43_44]|nr:MAG: hypothetical protein A3B08_02950 [Candidatus Taylorbacteria bacterium RIFCSPLOWO2_01_FULL_43_44]
MKRISSLSVLVVFVLMQVLVSAEDTELLSDKSALAGHLFERVEGARFMVYEGSRFPVVRYYSMNAESGVEVADHNVRINEFAFVIKNSREGVYLQVDLFDGEGRILFTGSHSFYLKKVTFPDGEIWTVPERVNYLPVYLSLRVPVKIDNLLRARIEWVSSFGRSFKIGLYAKDGELFFAPDFIGTDSRLIIGTSSGDDIVIDLSEGKCAELVPEDDFWMIDPSYLLPPLEFNVPVFVPEIILGVPEIAGT